MGQPAFPQDIWLRERERLTASIRESNTRPATISGRAFAKAVYGVHPTVSGMTEQTLASITVTDMATIYATRVRPCRAKVSIVGAVTRAQAQELVGVLFSRLPAGAAPTRPCPHCRKCRLAAPSEQRIAFDSAQAHVLLGQPGLQT